MLKAAARRLWRSPDSVQFGIEPARALVLRGLDDAYANLLAALDGSRDLAALHDVAAASGLSAADVDELVGRLQAGGVLDDGASSTGLADQRGLRSLLPWERQQLGADVAVWSSVGDSAVTAGQRIRRRRAAGVRVVGIDRIGAQLCLLLASGGIAGVEPVDPVATQPGDLAPGGLTASALDLSRADGIRHQLAHTAPSVRTTVAKPDLWVLVGRSAFAEVPDLMRSGTAHLVVDVRPGSTLIGPFVRPGVTACSECLDRYRTDRDPSWPTVIAQLAGHQYVCVDLASATVAAAVAASQVFMHVDGDAPTTANALVDVRLPDATTAWRPVAAHPLCGCTWPG
jgi:hypothetical protein